MRLATEGGNHSVCVYVCGRASRKKCQELHVLLATGGGDYNAPLDALEGRK